MTDRTVRLTIEARIDSDLPDDLLVSQLRIRTGEALDGQPGITGWHTTGNVTDEEAP